MGYGSRGEGETRRGIQAFEETSKDSPLRRGELFMKRFVKDKRQSIFIHKLKIDKPLDERLFGNHQ